MNDTKSLAAKMAAVMGDVPTMIKNGQNVQQKYAYVTAEDVKAAIRPLLKKHKVAIFSSMVDVQRETATNRNNNTVITVLAKMRFTVVCGETGEKMECDWYGEANDYADKAVNKAATAAEKYWLINTFLLSTTEPDADEETIQVEAKSDPIHPATEAQRRNLETLYLKAYPNPKGRAPFQKWLSHNNYEPLTTDLAEDLAVWLNEQAAAAEPAPAGG